MYKEYVARAKQLHKLVSHLELAVNPHQKEDPVNHEGWDSTETFLRIAY